MKNLLTPDEFINESYQRQFADEEMNKKLFTKLAIRDTTFLVHIS
jgi:hypothetical protein